MERAWRVLGAVAREMVLPRARTALSYVRLAGNKESRSGSSARESGATDTIRLVEWGMSITQAEEDGGWSGAELVH